MGYCKEQLLARLKELQIGFSQYEHPAVLTVEAQAEHVGHLKGALSKNLFLKDKKHRFYIVSALADTKVDLKVLSQRLGLGKGGLRMAPGEALGEILQVPLGCVTPFALVNDSAKHVCLLLDQGFKSQECCLFHPLSNDMTIAISSRDLDKFLSSIGKTPAFVDLEANPPVGKDQPPDLAGFVPSDVVVLPNGSEKPASSQGPEVNNVPANNKQPGTTAKAAKPSNASQEEKSDSAVNSTNTFADPEKLVEQILEKTTSIVLSEVKENMEKYQEQLGTLVSNSIKKQLSLELKSILTMFKNTSYTEGFYAGTHSQPKRM